MQLKLLNFYKIVSQFATNIVGAFVALIIYNATGDFSYAFLYLFVHSVLRVVFNAIFKKLYLKYAQLFLLIRVVPFLIYTLAILLLDVNLWVGLPIVTVFHALSISFRDLPMEFTFNYSTATETSFSNAGITRLIEFAGLIIAMVAGGLFLDYIDYYVVIIISIATYIISVIPLLIFYFRYRKNKQFNKDAVSDAVCWYEDVKIKEHMRKNITKRMLLNYFLVYFTFCALDSLVHVFMLYAVKTGSGAFSYAGYIQASFYGLFGIGSLIAGYLDERKDITKLVAISAVFVGVLVCVLPFLIQYIIIEIVLFGIIGFAYSFLSLFCYSRMMGRAKVMGVSNKALCNRALAGESSTGFVFGFCAISPLLFVPSFFLMGIMYALCSFAIPVNEEKTRKMLVDYLCNNKLY